MEDSKKKSFENMNYFQAGNIDGWNLIKIVPGKQSSSSRELVKVVGKKIEIPKEDSKETPSTDLNPTEKIKK